MTSPSLDSEWDAGCINNAWGPLNLTSNPRPESPRDIWIYCAAYLVGQISTDPAAKLPGADTSNLSLLVEFEGLSFGPVMASLYAMSL
jgi:hypothetical protein